MIGANYPVPKGGPFLARREAGRFWPRALALLQLWLAACCLALDPGRELSQLSSPVKWQTAQGLPQNSIHDIAQTTDGYLWLATEAGLVRFDGSSTGFKTYDKITTRELKNNFIHRLLAGRDGSLWIGARGGGLVHYTKDGGFQAYTTNNGMPSDQIWALLETADGSLWIGTKEAGLARLKDGKITLLNTTNGLSNNFITALCEDAAGALWIGTDHGGLHRYFDGKITPFAFKFPFDSPIKGIVPDTAGGLWLGLDGDGLYHFADGNFTRRKMFESQYVENVQSLYLDREGALWIGTQHNGLVRYFQNRFASMAVAQGLSYDHVVSFLEDREGSLWVGTQYGGLNQLREGKFTTYTTAQGLSDDSITCLAEAEDKTLWVGTMSEGVNRFSQGKFAYFDVGAYTKKGVHALWAGHENTVWVGTSGGGLGKIRNNVLQRFYNTSHGLAGNEVSAVFEDSRTNVWVAVVGSGLDLLGPESGLADYANQFRHYTKKEGMPAERIRFMAEDSEGSIWLATQNHGIARLKEGKFTVLTTRDGLSDNYTRSLRFDSDGTLWVATRDGGLNRYRNGKFAAFTTENGFFHDQIHHILEDDTGAFWLPSNRGIGTVSKAELNRHADLHLGSPRATLYNEADGMPSSECNGGFSPSGLRSSDGRLWFPTKRGLAMIDPNHVRTNHVKPPVLIEEVRYDGVPVPVDRPAVFPQGSGKLHIQYTALSMRIPEKVFFRYKLEGSDTDWTPPHRRREAVYYNLKHGNYRFLVQACNDDGLWNNVGADFPMTLTPHFYQAGWFYAACASLLALSARALHRMRVRKIAAHNAQLEALVGQRTTELQGEIFQRQAAQEQLRETNEGLEQRVLERTSELKTAGDRLQQQLLDRQKAELEIQRLNESLEMRVDERTRELAAANQQLANEIVQRQRVSIGLAAFSNLGKRLHSATTEEQAARIILEVANELIGWDACTLCSCVGGGVRPILSIGPGEDFPLPRAAADLADHPVVRKVIGEGAQFVSTHPAAGGVRRASFMCVPIRNADKTVGLVAIQNHASSVYTNDELRSLQSLADHCGAALEHIQAQETLRSVPIRVLEAQETERHRVAAELHDSVNQLLSLIASRVKSALGPAQPAPGGATEILRLIDEAMQEVLRISRDLRPTLLDDFGLLPAIRKAGESFAQRTGVLVQLNAAGLPDRLPGKMELTLYRIFQEALHNVEKHSRATRVWIDLHAGENLLVLKIRDNGVGFTPGSPSPDPDRRSGVGIINMRERSAFLAAKFTIDAAPGRGVEITAEIPWSQAAQPTPAPEGQASPD